MYNTILVALDGSEYSDKALVTACKLSELYQAKLHIVHVCNYMQSVIMAEGALMLPQEEYEQADRELLERLVERSVELGCTSVEPHFEHGSPGNRIVDVAEEIGADLIILGAKGHGNLTGLVLGSVSHRVCNTAKCSCMVVR